MATILVKIAKLEKNIISGLISQGHTLFDAKIICETIIFAEVRANNQGIVKLVAGGLRSSPASSSIKTVHETKLSAKIDGGQRIGMVVVSHCVDMAITKAKDHGIGLIGCSNYSSATGALGVWAKKIANNGLIGIVLTQCPEMVAPFGSFEPIFGTNPLAIGLPTIKPVVLDMATSAQSWYSLVTAKETGESIGNDVAYDDKGISTTNPAEALKGALRVFDRGFKGSHLALMVELLAGAWTGAAMENKGASKNWGSVVIAIDPELLCPLDDFQNNAELMLQRVKNAKLLPTSSTGEIPTGELFLPGERGDQVEEKNRKLGTIEMNSDIYAKLLLIPENETAVKKRNIEDISKEN